jgi:hypothetical protein
MGMFFYITLAMAIISLFMLILGWKGSKTLNNSIILIILILQILVITGFFNPFNKLTAINSALILTALIIPMSLYSYSGNIKALSIILFFISLIFIVLGTGIIKIGIGV